MVKTKSNFNANRLKERIENAGQSKGTWYLTKSDDLKSYKTVEGDNFIRVLPAYDQDHDFAMDIFVHYNIGADKSAFLCLSRMKGESCPICEESSKLSQAGREEEAKGLRPASRTLFFVLDRDKEEDGIKLYDSPTSSVGDPLISLCLNRRTREMVDITDIHKGFDVIIVRKGLGVRNTRYKSVSLDHPSTPLGKKDFTEEMLENLIPFESVLNYADYDTIKAEFTGVTKTKEEESSGSSEPVKLVDIPIEDELPEIDLSEDDCPEGFEFGEDYKEEDECGECNTKVKRACRKEHKILNQSLT
jgi:hypothetical protein